MASGGQQEDQQLIEKIRQGDQKAFRALFDKFYQLMLSVAINFLKDLNTAKDAVQEVFFQIWKNRETLQIHSSVQAYLKRAVINKSLNIIRARKTFEDEAELEHTESRFTSVQEELEAGELNEVIQKTIDQLPERCRLVFVMRRMEGMSHAEIAEKLDISPKTIENQMTKALKILKQAVEPYVKKKIS